MSINKTIGLFGVILTILMLSVIVVRMIVGNDLEALAKELITKKINSTLKSFV